MKELRLKATTENLDQVISFIDTELESAGCTMKAQMQIEIAVEELFVNIAHYAYEGDPGPAWIQVDTEETPGQVRITFVDRGMPYDPLAKEDPDVTLSADEREIGGLGIFMAKKNVDSISYIYQDGKNRLTIRKKIR